MTGARTSPPARVTHFLAQVRAVAHGPVAVGFGVSTPDHARRLAALADGVIVATALVDALGPARHRRRAHGPLSRLKASLRASRARTLSA